MDYDEQEESHLIAIPKIRQEPGRLKTTKVNICGYEMH